MASPIDGHCKGSRQETVGRYPRSLESDVRPRRIEDEEKGLLQRLRKPYYDLTVVYMVRKRRVVRLAQLRGRSGSGLLDRL